MNITGIVIICGNYGSGKTETSINLAVKRKNQGIDVKIADLDLVNPYFRTREARDLLKALGVEVVLPDRQYMNADLPILSPAVAGIVRQPSGLTILDTGGDDAGVIVLGALKDHLEKQEVQMLQVINPFRLLTQTVEGCIKIKNDIETSSKMSITGLIGNANLMDETSPEHIYKGYELLENVSTATGLDTAFITADSKLLPLLEVERFDCPVLEIDRKLTFPWKRVETQRS